MARLDDWTLNTLREKRRFLVKIKGERIRASILYGRRQRPPYT